MYQRDETGAIIPGTKPTWVQISTDADGFNDDVYLTTLAQVLQGVLNESPFYANYGLPQQQSVMTQVFPDYYMLVTQNQFSQYFASLIISKENLPTPNYRVDVTTNRGSRRTVSVAV